jgi:hypothetical protein
VGRSESRARTDQLMGAPWQDAVASPRPFVPRFDD